MCHSGGPALVQQQSRGRSCQAVKLIVHASRAVNKSNESQMMTARAMKVVIWTWRGLSGYTEMDDSTSLYTEGSWHTFA